MIIRPAALRDCRKLLEIYAPYVTGTTVTFEYTVPTEEEFSRRIREFSAFYPYLVCEDGGRLLGYAYAHRGGERAAYDWLAEVSIYIRTDCRGIGLGRRLYGALTELLKAMGVQDALAVISLPNPQSVVFHSSMGFETMGVFPKTGYKLGQWLDTEHMQLALGDHEADPKPPVPMPSLDQKTVEEILGKYCR